jgi:NAD(P)-dependent dehydrogenase (short-subunit alcohol dehydrogenase family)
MDMTEKIALITGANKGIGFETARQLGAAGMTVLVGARHGARGREAERVLREGGANARHVELDVASEESVRKAAAQVAAEYGRLDILVNNAGITGSGGPPGARPSETPVGVMRAVYETNVFGVIAVTNAMLPLLRRADAGRIVNVSSEVGSVTLRTDPEGPQKVMPPSLPYPSSKTALNMVTVMYAIELKDTPIKVNAANPGYTATDLNGRTGFRAAAEGAEVSVFLATLPGDGPSGVLWGYEWATGGYGVLPW